MMFHNALENTVYEVDSTHQDWDKVILVFLGTDGVEYIVNVIHIKCNISEVISDITKGIIRVHVDSTIGNAHLRKLGDMKDFPEYFL